MQGREAKHIKLKKYIENTTNVQKSQRWEHVFRHEHIAVVWLRDIDPHSVSTGGKAWKVKPRELKGNITFQKGVERVITASVVFANGS